MSKAHEFTRATAPRQGRRRGSRNRITAQSMKVIDALLADFAKHGKAAIDILRVEKPAEYARLCADVALKWAIAEQTGQMLGTTPRHITVRWLSAPPPVLVSDNATPLIELHADADSDDAGPASSAS
jgi:hypothetical protein